MVANNFQDFEPTFKKIPSYTPVYDLINCFFLSNDFESSYITFDIFNNLTFFCTTEKTNEK